MNEIPVDFRPLTESDLPLLGEWLSRPHLQKWWREERLAPDELREKYLPRISGVDTARPYVVLLDGQPVGYIQYYYADRGDPDWWPDQPGKGVLGIDQFIGDEDNLDRGIGTRLISAFTQRLFANREVTEIRVDPSPDNVRAIRCYEKVGFKKMRIIRTPDGPALWMSLKKEDAV